MEMFTPKSTSSVDITKAKTFLKRAISIHEAHMNGSMPTTGKAGEASQETMMEFMMVALIALGGK